MKIYDQGKIKDRVGLRFNHLVIKEFKWKIKTENNLGLYYLCKCDCGNEKIMRLTNLQSGRAKSCGITPCPFRPLAQRGLSTTPEYGIHNAMLNRCLNSDNANYHHYGGRGIKVCKQWQGEDGFKNFLKDMGPKPEGMTLERIDNNKEYSPENCKWAFFIEQANNRRDNKLITFEGETHTMMQWSILTGINYSTLRGRLNRFPPWTPERALTTK